MQLKSFKVAGYKIRTTNENGQCAQDIGEHWDKVLSGKWLDNIPHQIKDEIIALYYEYESDHTKPYSMLLGVPVHDFDELPEGVVGVEIPAQEYALFEAKGKMPDAVVQTWQKIWKSPMRRNYQFDFEVYDAHSYGETPLVNIWIGLETVKS